MTLAFGPPPRGWRLGAACRPAGDVVSTLAWFGPREVEDALAAVAPKVSADDMAELTAARRITPAWVAEPAGALIADGRDAVLVACSRRQARRVGDRRKHLRDSPSPPAAERSTSMREVARGPPAAGTSPNMRQFLECGWPKVFGYRDSEKRAAMLVPSKQKAHRRKPRAAAPQLPDAPFVAIQAAGGEVLDDENVPETARRSPRSHAPTRGRCGPREPPQPPHARRLHGTRRPRRRLALGRHRPKDLRHRRDGRPPGLNRRHDRTRRGHPSHGTVQAMADLREPHDCLAGEAHIAGTALRTD